VLYHVNIRRIHNKSYSFSGCHCTCYNKLLVLTYVGVDCMNKKREAYYLTPACNTVYNIDILRQTPRILYYTKYVKWQIIDD
jgi:hypothetical protein